MTFNLTKSRELMETARGVMPGGVNSPVRAYGSIGGTPPFIEQASGSRVIDADGNSYIDLVMSYGPLILGYVPLEFLLYQVCLVQVDRHQPLVQGIQLSRPKLTGQGVACLLNLDVYRHLSDFLFSVGLSLFG